MEIGRILGGRYKIVERIGSGGMSTVYKAHEVGLEREVAVKVLITALSADPQLVERFNREARTIAGLQHNSIIPIYFYGIEDDFGSYLVMPLLKGGTLDQRLEQLTIRPSITEVGELADKLGSALQYAHDNGVVHRDIKFSNIMFDDAGSPYLMDFGIAKMLGATNLTGTGMTVGTPQFMPPEQWRNEDITPAVDQYALAILLYAMMTQRMPFDAPTPHALMYQHLQEAPPLARDFRGDVPETIEDALHKALNKNPNERFDKISEFTNTVAEAARSATREYSGFFKVPIEPKKGETRIGTKAHRMMPDTPTEMVASSKVGISSTVPSDNNRDTEASNNVPEPTSLSQNSGNNRGAFIGGLVATLIVGAIAIAAFIVMNQPDTPVDDATEVLDSGISLTEAADTNSATETAFAIAAITEEASPTVPSATPTVTASNTATRTPDATGTALADLITERAVEQVTNEAILQLTGTALASLATSQAIDNATATRESENAISTAQANQNAANTATIEAEAIVAAQAELDATNTAIAISSTEQAQNEADATATTFANNNNATATTQAQNDADATATIEIENSNATATTQVQSELNATATADTLNNNATATAQAQNEADATATADVFNNNETATTQAQIEANATATTVMDNNNATATAQAQNDADATATTISENNNATATAEINNRNATATTQAQNDTDATATAFALAQANALTEQANFNATATANALPTEVVGNPIMYGEAVVVDVDETPSHNWIFDGEAGDLISISVRSADFDTQISLYRNEQILVTDDDGGYRLDSRISNYRIDRDARYRVEVSAFNDVALEGEYTIGITEMLDCPSVLASQTLVGEFARVTLEGGSNRMRQGPSTSTAEVDRIPEGGVFEVLQGPVCADGFAWYQVDYDDVVGWTAEGDDTTYFLELMPDDGEPVILVGGQGLTNGADLNPGEFQVEYYCSRRGLTTTSDGIDWFCVNNNEVAVITLVQSDFDQICRDTYEQETALAQQDGDGSQPAFQWRCYYHPE